VIDFILINNLDNEKYQPLLDGCAFTYFGISYSTHGIKALLADYLAKYVLQVNTNFGPLVQQIKHHKMVKLLIEIV
jgi:hypothetical protein